MRHGVKTDRKEERHMHMSVTDRREGRSTAIDGGKVHAHRQPQYVISYIRNGLRVCHNIRHMARSVR